MDSLLLYVPWASKSHHVYQTLNYFCLLRIRRFIEKNVKGELRKAKLSRPDFGLTILEILIWQYPQEIHTIKNMWKYIKYLGNLLCFTKSSIKWYTWVKNDLLRLLLSNRNLRLNARRRQKLDVGSFGWAYRRKSSSKTKACSLTRDGRNPCYLLTTRKLFSILQKRPSMSFWSSFTRL